VGGVESHFVGGFPDFAHLCAVTNAIVKQQLGTGPSVFSLSGEW